MFGSDIIDAAIGLFLIYFLFSVLCSALNEWIVGHMRGLRAKTLEAAIERLLAGADAKNDFFGLPLIKSLTNKSEAKPSYLSSATFVDALFTLVKAKAKAANQDLDSINTELESLRNLVRNNLKDVGFRPTLESLLAGAKDMDEARKKLEAWFNEGMDRATGWYKKHVQIWTAALAVGVVVFFNADTFTIAQELMRNSKLRATLVAAAQETVRQPPGTNTLEAASNNVAAIERKINELELPIGWAWHTNTANPPATTRTVLRKGEDWPRKIGGLLVTACAVSLGAPFWFDLLGKLVNLRAAGKKPEPPKEEKKK